MESTWLTMMALNSVQLERPEACDNVLERGRMGM